MTIWFSKRFNGKKKCCSKSISIRFIPKHWKLLRWKDNGAIKGEKGHTCYDLNIQILGWFFSYTNWDYGRNNG